MEGILGYQEKLFIIDKLPLFADLTISLKKFIAGLSIITEYKKEEIVYKEGAPPDAFYCIISGRLKAYITKKDKEDILEYLKRGKYFGIISLLTDEPHSVTVKAINDSLVLKIEKKNFDKIIKRIPHLALHFSRTLSRRLRRKDIHEKRVFESTIISVFGTADRVGVTTYSLNLAAGLKSETGKKIILVDVSGSDKDSFSLLGIKTSPQIIDLDAVFHDEKLVKGCVVQHPAGIDVIHIPHVPKRTANISPLLSYLTNDYHYIIIDLPGYMDKITFECMKQSDIVHIITASDGASLGFTGKLVAELKRSTQAAVGDKIKIITTDYGPGKILTYANRRAVLGSDVFATLPDINKSVRRIDRKKIIIAASRSDSEYWKVIRRISREIGERLVGLALGCGASQGLAHIGVLKVIEREKIPIDVVAGTSMGAAIGAFWAAGYSASDIEKVFTVFKNKIKALSLADFTIPKKGLIRGRAIRRFLRSHLGNKTFYDLKMPFKAVAYDIEKREEVVIDKGSLVDAIIASVSIAGVFEPVRYAGRLLVDGGIINPLPTSVLIRSGITRIIAVNALPSPEDIQKSKKRVSSIFDVIVNCIQGGEYPLTELSAQTADVSMHPILPTVDWYEMYHISRIIRTGETEASKYIAAMKELARC